MTNLLISETGVENLDKHSRVARGLLGAGLIAFVMTTPEAPLGWYAILPLIAILPIFSAITGWDPVKAFFRHSRINRWALHFSRPLRLLVGAVGVAMIGSVYVASYMGASLGLLTILPILGIYPVFAAIAGMDPITALYNLDRDWVESEEVGQETQSIEFSVIKGRQTTDTEQEKQPHSKAA
ncbi:YgaP family membrane protein [Kaarinaea lacus]